MCAVSIAKPVVFVQTRGVSHEASAPIPDALHSVLKRVATLPGTPDVDQITVNDYPPGEGLSPHVDTHSAFTGPPLMYLHSVEAGVHVGKPPCLVIKAASELCTEPCRSYCITLSSRHRGHGVQTRRRSPGFVLTAPISARHVRPSSLPGGAFIQQRLVAVQGTQASSADIQNQRCLQWAHYIPHRKHDNVDGEVIARGTHRVSFTFRQVCISILLRDSMMAQQL